MLKLYAYQGCSTCRNAVKWLKQHGIPFEEIAIREQPPTTLELEAALKSRGGDLGALFNRSGQDYRALGMKDKLPAMSQSGALQLLSKNGNLVKRPFAIDEKKRVVLVGFKETEWESALAVEVGLTTTSRMRRTGRRCLRAIFNRPCQLPR
jgi:arsenate reductase